MYNSFDCNCTYNTIINYDVPGGVDIQHRRSKLVDHLNKIVMITAMIISCVNITLQLSVSSVLQGTRKIKKATEINTLKKGSLDNGMGCHANLPTF